MTVYVVSASNFRSKGETLTEVFSHKEDAIALLRDLYTEACADPKISEEEWYGDASDCCPGCSWFDPRVSWDNTYVTILKRELL